MTDTAIQWTRGEDGSKGKTWNPIAAFDKETGKRGWFCVHASRGCDHCYAEAFNRFRGNGHTYTAQQRDLVECRIVDSVLDQPLHWRKPRRVFVCSMTDLFLDEHTDAMIARVFAVMAFASQHTFIVLTKRAARMRALTTNPDFAVEVVKQLRDVARALGAVEEGEGAIAWPLPNVWGGVTCENQKTADERIPDLLLSRFAVRWVSAEPLLEYVDILESIRVSHRRLGDFHPVFASKGGVDWVVIGGESGAGARPFDTRWARRMARECQSQGVRVFVKQLGARPVDTDCGDGSYLPNHKRTRAAAKAFGFDETDGLPNILLLKDRHGGDMAEWPEDLRVREFPETVTA